MGFVAVNLWFNCLYSIVAIVCLLALVPKYLGLNGDLVQPLKLLLHLIKFLGDFSLLITLLLDILFKLVILVYFLNLVLDFKLEYIIFFHSFLQFFFHLLVRNLDLFVGFYFLLDFNIMLLLIFDQLVNPLIFSFQVF